VEVAGIAATGPIGEFLSAIDDAKLLAELKRVAVALLAHNEAALGRTERRAA